jgi:hypothetical protein
MKKPTIAPETIRKINALTHTPILQPHSFNQYINYLLDRLIPDLRDSGHNATAEDFETCLRIIAFLDLHSNYDD